MKYYPVCLDLRERPCVIVGGGHVAERKALSLLEAGANVTVVSPTLTEKLEELSSSGKITHFKRTFEEADLARTYIVIAATDDPGLNAKIGKDCRKRQILVNVVAPPSESTFIVPSIVERGGLLIAISTSGESPALSKKIRVVLEQKFGPEYEIFLQKMSLLRSRLIGQNVAEGERRRIFEEIVNSDVLDLLAEGKLHDADYRIADISGVKLR